ncbi:MAG: putative ATPase with chaperone activity, two ATP-binding domain, partial [Firmicutes bacterium]|nr:putative ATPase with chaperone activity, two ATP-binding domain [Bacillota bacterium]
LIGSPPGYVGYDEGGQLTEAVRRRPYSVVLFDEIEKAHNDVFNILLQILDDGRLTDGQGRTVDFRNTIIIMTSNLGSQEILHFQEQGGNYERMKDSVMSILKQYFRPEFLNRLDEIIVFQALSTDQIEKITDLLLQTLARRFEKNLGGHLQWDENALRYLAGKGYDPAYGARPLKRLIQQEVETLLSRKIISGEIKENSLVQMSASDEGIILV